MLSSYDGLPLPDEGLVASHIATLRRTSTTFEALWRRYGSAAPALRHYRLIQWQAGEMGAAAEAFSGALALTPEDGEIWRDLANVHDAAGRTDLAIAAAGAAVRRRPDDARSWLLIGNLRQRTGEEAEAEVAFRRALACDSTLGDAYFALGLALFGRRRIEEAVVCLGTAVSHGYANALGYGALGHALYVAGRFVDCAEAFKAAADFGALDTASLRRYARALTFSRMITGDPDHAMMRYAETAGAAAEDPADILRDAFALLSAYGHVQAAVAVGRLRLARDPDDAAQRYLLGAVSGEALTCAPLDYVESHFDGFAPTFDHKLVEVLLYRLPETMARLVAGTGRLFSETLDIGCGTGLAAAHLAPFGGRLTGVDISRRMLDEAAKRGLYSELVKAEAVDFLNRCDARYDLVFAADMLIYIGDLAALFDSVARAMRPGTILAISSEMAADGHFVLLPSGRFAHSAPYIAGLAEPRFKLLTVEPVDLRLEAGSPAPGFITLLERRA